MARTEAEVQQIRKDTLQDVVDSFLRVSKKYHLNTGSTAILGLQTFELICENLAPAFCRGVAYGSFGELEPSIEEKRFAVLFIHNLALRPDAQSVLATVEQTCNEYLSRYEEESELGEDMADKILLVVGKD